MKIRPEDALEYHSASPAGKVSVTPTKPCQTQRDLSLAYTPGVAVPCLEIERDASLAYKYTAKGNLVAVVTNGTAVLGLGNIGALAGKPVMEGKGVLFKRFADIDVFDIELASEDPKEIIRTCQILEPTFGGINLEDIKAPECFHIEEELKKTMRIPVFHDDQHGTAIISGAGLINALEIAGKPISEVKVVFCGAGAAEHNLDLRDGLAGDLQRVDQARAGNDGGAVLIVVEDRNPHGLLQLFLDVEALGRLNVLQVDAAEGGLQDLAGANDFFRVLGVQLDVENVDIGEAFEQHALALHHGLSGQGADVAEAQHGGPVAHHGHQVPLGGVLIGEAGLALDFLTRNGHAGRIGKAEVPLGMARLGGGDRHLPRRRRGMVCQEILPR